MSYYPRTVKLNSTGNYYWNFSDPCHPFVEYDDYKVEETDWIAEARSHFSHDAAVKFFDIQDHWEVFEGEWFLPACSIYDDVMTTYRQIGLRAMVESGELDDLLEDFICDNDDRARDYMEWL